MKKLLLLSSVFVLLMTGCARKETIVDVQYIEKTCPKFPIEEFEPVKDYDVKNISVNEVDGKKFVNIPMEDFMGLIGQYKEVKKNYSILRTNIIEFQKGNE